MPLWVGPSRAIERRWIGAAAAVLLALCASALRGEGVGESKQIILEGSFKVTPGIRLKPLVFHPASKLQAEWQKLVDRETKLTDLETVICGDLGGRTKVARASEAEEKEAIARDIHYYMLRMKVLGIKGIKLGDAKKAMEVVGNSRVVIVALTTMVNREIRQVAADRRDMEAAYLEAIMTVPKREGEVQPGAPYYFTTQCGAGMRGRIVKALRARVFSIREIRQETVENMLMVIERARLGISVAAVAESAVAWRTAHRPVAELKRQIEAAERRIRERRLEKEAAVNAARQFDLELPKLKKKSAEAKPGTARATAEAKVALNESAKEHVLKQAQAARDAITAEEKKIAAFKKKIEALEKGVEVDRKKGKKGEKGNARQEGNTAEDAAAMGGAVSETYAALTYARRRYTRATFEAQHLYGAAKKFADRRQQYHLARQLASRVAAADGTIGGAAVQAFEPKRLRLAYLDQGLIILLRRELGAEDAFLTQTDYLYGLWQAWDKLGGKMQGGLLTKAAPATVLKYALGMAQVAMAACGSSSNALMDIVTDQFGAVWGWKPLNTELDKIHKRTVDKRVELDKQVKLLTSALTLADAKVLPTLLPGANRALLEWTFVATKKPKDATAHDLFRQDRDFYEKLDGGLRRICAAIDTHAGRRIVSEYLIEYDKAGFVLRDLQRVLNAKIGLKKDTGSYDWSQLLKPVDLYVTLKTREYDEHIGLEVRRHKAWRERQHTWMSEIFATLARADFDLGRLAEGIPAGKLLKRFETTLGQGADGGKTLPKSDIQRHWALYVEHPQYRRFWHKAMRERATLIQKDLLKTKTETKTKPKDWWQKNLFNETLESSIAASPSEAILSRVHFQDGLDKIQCCDYPGALNDFVKANQFDPDFLSQAAVMDYEQTMAYYEAGEQIHAVGSTVGNAVVWYLLTQGMLQHLGYVKQVQFNAMDFFAGQVIPLYSFIPYKTVMKLGVLASLPKTLLEVGWEYGQRVGRDGVLVGGMGMNPELADRIASLIWAVAGKYKERSEAWAEQTWLFKRGTLFFLCGRLDALKKRLATDPEPTDLLKVMDDKDTGWLDAWLAHRRAAAVLKAVALSSEAAKLMDELGIHTLKGMAGEKLHLPPKSKSTDEEELDPVAAKKRAEELDARVAEVSRQRDMALVRLTPEVLAVVVHAAGLDVATAKTIFDGDLKGDAKTKVLEDAVNLLRRFDGLYFELGEALSNKEAWGDNLKQRAEIKETLDIARRTLHHESFGRLVDSDGPMARALIDDASATWTTKNAKSKAPKPESDNPFTGAESLNPQRLAELMAAVVAIVPTGSVGYVDEESGEYNKWQSDLDFTFVVRPDVDAQPYERKAIELLLAASFRSASGGLDADSIDAAYMADDLNVTLGKSVELDGPAAFLLKCSEATSPDEIKAIIKAQEKSYGDLKVNAPHGERYLSPDRIRALVWLNSLGQDILVRVKGKAGFVKMKKSKELPAGIVDAENVRKLLDTDGPNIKLESWMALGIVIDDLGFLGKKLPALTEELHRRPGNRAPMDDLVKELDKRAIRILLGFIVTDPDGLRELNDLARRVVKEGARCDHKTICEIGKRVLVKHKGAVGDAADILDSWAAVKLGDAKGLDLVLRRAKRLKITPPPDPTADPGKFMELLDAEVNDTYRTINFLSQGAMQSGGKLLKPLFERRSAHAKAAKDLNATQADRDTAELNRVAVEQNIRHRMTSMAAWYPKLGGHLRKAERGENIFKAGFRKAFLEAGA
ncbi:hypothetical protein HQ560_02830, partial [bacterium]|nr:hypothetical protein [bacterium]